MRIVWRAKKESQAYSNKSLKQDARKRRARASAEALAAQRFDNESMEIVSVTTKTGEEIPVGKFTVLVGPNNVGKSQTLKDIHVKLVSGPNARSTIVKEVLLRKPPTFDALLSGLRIVDDPENIGHQLVRGITSNLTGGDTIRVSLENMRSQFSQSDRLDFTFGNLSRFRVSYLDAESRLNVTKIAGAHNPHTQPPQNLLQGLFAAEPSTEQTLRDAFSKAFGLDVRLDYSGMTQLALRVAKDFGHIPDDPRKAFPILDQLPRLDEQGDGFRSFAGVVLSLLLSEGRVVLLDEPEAFLHPAQARQLGFWIAEHARTVPGQILVATHNASFLAGILSSNQPVDIFRINRRENVTTYTRITPEATKSLATSPLLSSQRILEAVFFRGVVVCEADADRAVYQTVAARLPQSQEVLFVHAHNKQSIPKVVDLLRSAKIPTRAVADLDAIQHEADLKNLILSIDPAVNAKEVLQLRREIAASLGIAEEKAVLERLKERVREFLDQLCSAAHTLAGARGALNRLRKEANSWSDV